MSNICDVTYKITGDNKEIRSLHKLLKKIECRKTSIVPNGYGNWWLGNLVTLLGGDPDKCRCRGEITEFMLQDGILTIHQQTDWDEQEDVRQLIEKTYPSVKVYYLETEPCLELFRTNDSEGIFFPYRYYVEGPVDQSDEFKTMAEAAGYVSEIVGHPVNPIREEIDQALDDYADSHPEEDERFWFHIYDVVSD